jgi:hypothetical protein
MIVAWTTTTFEPERPDRAFWLIDPNHSLLEDALRGSSS